MEETENGFRVEIPPQRRPATIVFYAAFIALAAFCGYRTFQRLASDSKLLLATFIAEALVLFGVLGLLGELYGSEVIELDEFLVNVSDRLFGFKRNRSFDVTLMQNLRVGSSSYWQGSTYVMSSGKIQFEYRSRTVIIGGEIGDEEACQIVDRIRNQVSVERIPR